MDDISEDSLDALVTVLRHVRGLAQLEIPHLDHAANRQTTKNPLCLRANQGTIFRRHPSWYRDVRYRPRARIGYVPRPRARPLHGSLDQSRASSHIQHTRDYAEGNMIAAWEPYADEDVPDQICMHLVVFAYRPVEPAQPLVLWEHLAVE